MNEHGDTNELADRHVRVQVRRHRREMFDVKRHGRQSIGRLASTCSDDSSALLNMSVVVSDNIEIVNNHVNIRKSHLLSVYESHACSGRHTAYAIPEALEAANVNVAVSDDDVQALQKLSFRHRNAVLRCKGGRRRAQLNDQHGRESVNCRVRANTNNVRVVSATQHENVVAEKSALASSLKKNRPSAPGPQPLNRLPAHSGA